MSERQKLFLLFLSDSILTHTPIRWIKNLSPKITFLLSRIEGIRSFQRIIRTGFTHTYSLSVSATVHLYWAVENRQMSANCLTETLIFLTVLLELLAMWTLTAIFSPWWYNCNRTQNTLSLILRENLPRHFLERTKLLLGPFWKFCNKYHDSQIRNVTRYPLIYDNIWI